MAITAIRYVRNDDRNVLFEVINFEHPADTGGVGKSLLVYPGQIVTCKMWIPWCDQPQDFPKHHILIREMLPAGDPILSFCLWQSGNFVRCEPKEFVRDARKVGGEARVGGDRLAEIGWTGDPGVTLH